MNKTLLSDTVIDLISQLAENKHKQANHQKTINKLEEKLRMAREASLNLTNQEQELTTELQFHGYYCGNEPSPQHLQQTQQVGPIHDQLAALLSNLFTQSQQPSQAPSYGTTPVPSAPTSGSNFGYQWPQPRGSVDLGPIALNSPNTRIIPRIPGLSPTSAPSYR